MAPAEDLRAPTPELPKHPQRSGGSTEQGANPRTVLLFRFSFWCLLVDLHCFLARSGTQIASGTVPLHFSCLFISHVFERTAARGFCIDGFSSAQQTVGCFVTDSGLRSHGPRLRVGREERRGLLSFFVEGKLEKRNLSDFRLSKKKTLRISSLTVWEGWRLTASSNPTPPPALPPSSAPPHHHHHPTPLLHLDLWMRQSFRHFLIELLRQEVDNVFVGLKTRTNGQRPSGKTKRTSGFGVVDFQAFYNLQDSKVDLIVQRQDATELWVVGAVQDGVPLRGRRATCDEFESHSKNKASDTCGLVVHRH